MKNCAGCIRAPWKVTNARITRACSRRFWKRDNRDPWAAHRVIESEEVSPGVVLDYNAENQVVGVEILNLSKRVPRPELNKLVFEPCQIGWRVKSLNGSAKLYCGTS
ncbi:DUF2283 domain-containing protein [Methylohalobius crimeensis]|uniref:DUF2283 domain-containing protein n=1 Tax=Methylohalobius crimeensis TaxID=244365 RepID=UPI0038993A68